MAIFENKIVVRSDDGKTVLGTYDIIKKQSNGITFAFVNDKGWGVLDKYGKETISPQFLEITDYENGYAIFTTQSPFDQGAIDENGHIVVQADFDAIHGFNENGISIVTCNDFSNNLINTSGKKLLSTEYYEDNVHFEVSYNIVKLRNGFFDICKNNDLHALANPCGEIITAFEYKCFYVYSDLFIATIPTKDIVLNHELQVVIDSTGKKITDKNSYANIVLNKCIITYNDTSLTLTIFDMTGNVLFSRRNCTDANFNNIYNTILLFFNKHPEATVSNDNLIVPWEHLCN